LDIAVPPLDYIGECQELILCFCRETIGNPIDESQRARAKDNEGYNSVKDFLGA
jgi:hypothetical protein